MATDKPDLHAIFSEAIALALEEDRARYVDQACGDDAQLKARVQDLLRAHSAAGQFFGGKPADLGATEIRPMSERPGDTIGPYKLLQQIGEGGMGVVYMAEQKEPVERRVALKIIKPGMDTRQVIARFEAERQALALMEHPNVAKVLDAGTTDSGRPYFVMELVKGQPITQYCDEHHLTPRERLELFLPVCRAIQHAHQKGIIHRDIKATNILVAEFDEKAVPKVIDFGVAKAIGQSLTEKTMFTGLGQIVGTLEYMSPEQAKVNQLDIDTRSDVYSLGVLLYELLTGSTPLDKQRLRSAAWDEMLRIIREEEPEKPSTRLSQSNATAPRVRSDSWSESTTLASIAALRNTEPARLSKLVRGELDWIVMKALEKDRNRRYETASGFARDIEHYLNDEPVQACPPSLGYRFRKFTRRNKGGLAVAALVLFFLVLLGSGVGWVVRDREAREAAIAQERTNREAELNRERESRKAKATGQIDSIFAEVDRLEGEQSWPEALAAARQAEAAAASGEADEATVKRVHQRLKDLEFLDRLEQIRMQQATMNGGKFDDALGADRDYALTFRDYGADVDVLPVETSIDRLQTRPALVIPLAAALDDWVLVRRRDSERDAARWKRLVAVARGIDSDPLRDQLRSTWGQPISEVEDELRRLAESIDIRTQHPATLRSLVQSLVRAKQSDSALRILRDAQYVYPGDFWLNFELGRVLYERKDHEGAVRFNTAAVSIRPNSAWAHNNLGAALHEQKKRDEAIACFKRAMDLNPADSTAPGNLDRSLIERSWQRDETLPTLELHDHLNLQAYFLRRDGDLEQARKLRVRVVERAKKLMPAEDARRVKYQNDYVDLLLAMKRYEEAESVATETLRLLPSEEIISRLMVLRSLADLYEQWNKPEEAERHRELVNGMVVKAHPVTRARYYVALSQWDQAAAAYAEAGLGSQPLNDDAFAYACLFLIKQDRQGYDRFCHDLIRRVGQTASASECFFLAKTCTIANTSSADPERAVEWASQDVASFQNPWDFHVLGMAQYRAGQFDEALQSFTKANVKDWYECQHLNWLGLALVYHSLDQPEEARECLCRGLQWLERLGPAYFLPHDWLPALVLIREVESQIGVVSAQQLAALRQKRWDRELATLSDEFRTKPDDPAPLSHRARLYVRSGRFEQAVSDFDRLVQLAPADHWLWYHRGCLLAYLGRETEYREHCRAMLEQFADSKDLGVLDRTTKSALLLPGGIGGDIQQLAARAWKSQPTDPNNHWFALLMGMVELRSSRPNEAILWLEKCRAVDLSALGAAAEAFLAIAHHRIGHEDEAATALARCMTLIERDLPEAGVEDLDVGTGGIENWLIAQVARREAEEMSKKDAEEQKHDLKKSN